MKMIATAPAFYKGSRICAGQVFEYDDRDVAAMGMPRWAVPEGEQPPVRAPWVDSKPPEIAEAVQRKQEAWALASRGHIGETKPGI